jgi:hypothetical protein
MRSDKFWRRRVNSGLRFFYQMRYPVGFYDENW